MTDMVTHRGGCHCGRVRFEVVAPAKISVSDMQLLDVRQGGLPPSRRSRGPLQAVERQGRARDLTFNTRTAKHSSVPRAAIKSFISPALASDGYSVNARCIDPGTIEEMKVTPFDGRTG